MIERIKGGYEILIEESHGGTMLHVYDTGVVEDVSGAPVCRSDVTIAMNCVPPELKSKVRAWWDKQSRR